MAEMILPGTYIEVRAEGLISAGAIATGNIGIVGTAARGPRNEVRALGSYGEALDLFGAYDSFVSPNVTGSPLSLTRALEQAYRGGARSVYAVRIAAGDPTASSLDVLTDGGDPAFTLTAVDPGTWGDAVAMKIVDQGAPGAANWKLTLTYRSVTETFEGADVAAVHDAVGTSTLVEVGTVDNGTAGFATLDPAVHLAGGADEPVVSSIDVAAGLAELEDEPVNIVLVAGFGSTAIRGVVGAHLERTENEGKERIAVIGVADPGTSSDASAPIAEASAILDDRIALVAPGLVSTDATARAVVDLPASYLAAVVAGRLATVDPHISLTNKTVAVDNLQPKYTSTVYKNLLQNRMLLVRKKMGFQVVKAITTDNGAFKQISIRRTVDYAKEGVRQSSDPYIGRLNNARVRAAMQATLDGFLSQMVLDEMLVSYELSVTATRAQEIAGIAQVTMTLLPTFSIDFIKVTMNLQ